MPASLALEEALLKGTLNNEAYTPSAKIYIGLSTLKPSELTKKTTAKEFGEHEPVYTGWARIEIEKGHWKLTKGEGETGASVYKYEKEVKFTGTPEGSTVVETFAICEKLKGSEAGNILYFGKLTEKLTITPAISSIVIEPEKLEVQAE